MNTHGTRRKDMDDRNPRDRDDRKVGKRPTRGSVKTARSRHGRKVKINC